MACIKILVVTHKKYDMPEDNELFLPIQSGAAIWPDLGIQRDDVGENISEKNLSYNELCPMYWAWKNIEADYIGICHYRRLFANSQYNTSDKAKIVNKESIQKKLKQCDIILPRKKKYYFADIQTHYIKAKKGYETMHKKDLEVLRRSIKKTYPDYSEELEKVLHSNKAHMLHMCVMSREKYSEYCEFLFNVMLECETMLKDRKDQERYIGAISEFLMDVWINKNKYQYLELGILETEHEFIGKKLVKVLKRKFL